MATSGAATRVGLLILVGIALTLGFVWFLGGWTVGHAARCESYFNESVQGLEVGAEVKYRGVTLGRVTEIGLVSTEYDAGQKLAVTWASYRQVFVRYELDRAGMGQMPDTATMVHLGLRARLAAQGITGLSYIELDFVDPARYPEESPPWRPKAAYIPSVPSTLTQVQDAAQQVLAKLNTVDFAALATSLTQLVQDLREELTSGGAHAALEQTQELLRTLHDAVQAADLPGLSAEWRRTALAVRDTVQGEDMKRLLAGGAQSADRLARAAAQLPPLIAALQATTQRADGGVADLQRALVPLLRDMQAAAQNLREITEALRQAPAQVLLAPPPPRSSEEHGR
ncbi:MAG: MlaD family protein [Acetobacteraceae bacterium]|jgi:ABC-type transporter Mla subunit MlaD